MVHISKYQLFCLLVLFELGSTSLFLLGVEAEQDAWIAVIAGTIGGAALLWTYVKLQSMFQNKNIVEIIIMLLGRFWGIAVSVLYGLYFFYKSSIILREFSELILMSYLPRTPLIYVMISLIIIIVFGCWSGLEVLARTSEVCCPIVLIFMLITYILTICSNEMHLSELTPILSKGVMPVVYAAYPRILSFPYGEAFIFFMFWRHVEPKESICKTSLIAVAVAGLIITASAVIIISVLSVEFASNSTIPLLQIIKLINIGDILTNLDAIGVTIIFIGGFYKIIMFFYGTIQVINTVFEVNSSKLLIAIMGAVAVGFSYYFIPSYEFSLWLGKKIHPFLMNTPMLVFNPILLLAIAYIKNRNNAVKKA
ncbi:GerAB/ArcD/ProY family transporter [Clostridium sp. 19966]|uniref:GerAB/ArcD/ProY family transporter n=1 Tax=Clostridium sp. 19966 TaxID=2768166 RepID=UPI0028E01DC8|nr:GerAB/ArcD/ProY family transporter [Clostridium sp. 19966]MDT8717679.1 GerAB/ArcD/ProY family transporter [Clostridium sp. 19966]